MLLEKIHIEIAPGLQPPLMGLHRQRPDEPQATGRIREDPHHPGSPLDRFIKAIQHIGGLQVLMVLERPPVEAEGFANALFHPLAELRVFGPSALQPWPQVFLRFGQIPSVPEPARFLPAVIHGFPGQMIQGVSQKVHLAALPDRRRDHFGLRPLHKAISNGSLSGSRRTIQAMGGIPSLCSAKGTRL